MHTDTHQAMNSTQNLQTDDPDVLVFSIATHGYDIVWDRCLASQRAYADMHGYQYTCIANIPRDYTPDQVARSKIALMRHALEHYAWVMFVDSDCMIRNHCPAIQTLEKENKQLYLAPGFSGRVNSGVLIATTSTQTASPQENVLQLLDTLLAHKDDTLPPEDRVGRSFGGGENGHVIHYTKNNPILERIDQRRNNNHSPELDDYIRHYSA